MSEQLPSFSIEGASLLVNFTHQVPVDPTRPDGDKRRAETVLFVQKNQELPFLAVALQAQDPNIIATLITSLTDYLHVTELSNDQLEVGQYALGLLHQLSSQQIRLVQKQKE